MLCAIDDALLPLLDRPFALVGASLGGMLAYELAARLESLHGLRARQLFVISSRAPGPDPEYPRFHAMGDAELLRTLREYDVLPLEVLDDPELREISLATLRAPIRAWPPTIATARASRCHTDHRDPRRAGPGVSRAAIDGWRRHASRYELETTPAACSVVTAAEEGLILRQRLAPDAAAACRRTWQPEPGPAAPAGAVRLHSEVAHGSARIHPTPPARRRRPADYHRHLPEQVARGLPSAELVVFRVADEHSDTAAFSARYGFGRRTAPTPGPALQARRRRRVCRGGQPGLAAARRERRGQGAARGPPAVLRRARGRHRADRHGSAASPRSACPKACRWVDAAVFERPLVVMGAGVRETKLLLSPALLKDLPGVVVAELSEAG